LLPDQDLDTPVSVYARDAAGNEAVAAVDRMPFRKPFGRSNIDVDSWVARVVPPIVQNTPEMQLSIKVTDVKLAGDFEPWLGVPFNQTRIIKSIYPPRIVLEFRLIDDNGRVIKEGKRELTDVDYQRRDSRLREDSLRYEKELLGDWMREEFSALKSGKIG